MRSMALRGGAIEQPVSGLVVIGIVLGGAYGLCMGSFAAFQRTSMPLLQIVATTIKVPVLFFLTLAITFPSLYVFNALVGSRLSILSVVRLLVIALTIMLTVLASLGPIVAFFSASTTSYAFMVLLNVVFYSVAGFFGLRCVLVALRRLSEAIAAAEPIARAELLEVSGVPATPDLGSAAGHHSVSPPGRSIRDVLTVFRIWILVFGLVGAQMAWVLRPFLGAPSNAFTWLRPRSSSFFEALIYTAQHLFR